MLRYLPGLVLVQVVTAVLLWVNLGEAPRDLAIQFGVPALLTTLVTGLWFASIARGDADRANANLKLQHAREREKLHVDAEKSKARVIEKSHKEIRKSEKRIGRVASFKVGLAFLGATFAGIVMLITELFTFGLMTIMTTMGGLGGYLVRSRQSYDAQTNANERDIRVIDMDDAPSELPAPDETLPDSKK